jgi:hypothetical protein
MAEMTYTETLIVTHCWCGIAVAIPENLHRWLHESANNSCFCPVGHRFVFGNTYEEKLAEEKRRHAATRDLLNVEEHARLTEERSHAQTRGQLTRVRKRAAAGVCPVCHRTISQLARHMKSKHPSYETGEHDHAHEHEVEALDVLDRQLMELLKAKGAVSFGTIMTSLGLTTTGRAYALLRRHMDEGTVRRRRHGVYELVPS